MEFTFNEYQMEQIKRFLRDKHISVCHVCNTYVNEFDTFWNIFPAYVQFPLTMNLSAGVSIVIGGGAPGSVPAIGISCPNCKNIQFFNIIVPPEV